MLFCCWELTLNKLILVQLEFDGVNERQPTGFDDVFTDTDRAPDIRVVSAFDHHANSGSRASFGINDADFVVDKPHCR